MLILPFLSKKVPACTLGFKLLVYFSQAEEKKNIKPFQLFTIVKEKKSVFIPIANLGGLLLPGDPTFQLFTSLFCFSCRAECDPSDSGRECWGTLGKADMVLQAQIIICRGHMRLRDWTKLLQISTQGPSAMPKTMSPNRMSSSVFPAFSYIPSSREIRVKNLNFLRGNWTIHNIIHQRMNSWERFLLVKNLRS